MKHPQKTQRTQRNQRAQKRQQHPSVQNPPSTSDAPPALFSLLSLPEAALEMVLGHLDATSLVNVTATCKAFTGRELVDAKAAHGAHEQGHAVADAGGGTPKEVASTSKCTSPAKLLVTKPELAALRAVYRHCWQSASMAARWRHESILKRLLIEEAACGFDVQHALSNGFVLYKERGPRGMYAGFCAVFGGCNTCTCVCTWTYAPSLNSTHPMLPPLDPLDLKSSHTRSHSSSPPHLLTSSPPHTQPKHARMISPGWSCV